MEKVIELLNKRMFQMGVTKHNRAIITGKQFEAFEQFGETIIMCLP